MVNVCNILFYIGIVMAAVILCALLIHLFRMKVKKPREGIWIEKLKKDARDFIEKGM